MATYMNVCQRIIYTGRVQGVGFRHTTRQLAQDYPVAGYVRNLPDGTVEVLVEGPAEEVKAFLDALAWRMRAYITRTTVSNETPQGLQTFEIRY